MTQILFDEGLRSSFRLEPFQWLGSATVQWGGRLFKVTAFFANVAILLNLLMGYKWNDMFMAFLRDTNSL